MQVITPDLFPEHHLGLTTIPSLLAVIPSFTCGRSQRYVIICERRHGAGNNHTIKIMILWVQFDFRNSTISRLEQLELVTCDTGFPHGKSLY